MSDKTLHEPLQAKKVLVAHNPEGDVFIGALDIGDPEVAVALRESSKVERVYHALLIIMHEVREAPVVDEQSAP